MVTLESVYQRHLVRQTAITAHLPRLRELARGLELVIEFGVKGGASSSAFLLEARRVISYDIAETVHAQQLQKVVGKRWEYRIEDSLLAEPHACDLLFLDSLHTYEQVSGELRRHADYVEKLLVFHDVTTFGEVGAVGETGQQAWTYQIGQSVPLAHRGIRPAIDELMIRDDSWRIKARYTDSHGLLVLERR